MNIKGASVAWGELVQRVEIYISENPDKNFDVVVVNEKVQVQGMPLITFIGGDSRWRARLLDR